MKKVVLFFASVLTLLSFTASAQSAVYDSVKHSITYGTNQFSVGQELQLGYGSGANQDFIYVEAANYGLMKKIHFNSGVAKNKFTVTEAFVNREGKCILQGRANWTDNPNEDVIIVYVEAAIDKKELIAPNNVVPVAEKKPVAKPVIKTKH